MWSSLLLGCSTTFACPGPLPLVKDGDLIAIVRHMILARGPDTVKVTKVKGHACYRG